MTDLVRVKGFHFKVYQRAQPCLHSTFEGTGMTDLVRVKWFLCKVYQRAQPCLHTTLEGTGMTNFVRVKGCLCKVAERLACCIVDLSVLHRKMGKPQFSLSHFPVQACKT